MSPFDAMSLVKEPHFPVKDYYSFINLFQKQAEKFKDNIYVRYETVSNEGVIKIKTLTYGQVDLITTNLACKFHEKLSKKAVISILEDHSVYYVILLYALFKLRVPVQMISTRNSVASVCSLLNQVNSECLVYGESYQNIKEAVSKELMAIECLPRPGLNLEELSKVPLNPKFDQILDQNFTEKDLKRSLAIVHSSGTTNTPKAVTWSNQFLMYFIQSFQHTFYKRKQFEFIEDENDILIGITPSCHMFGNYSNFHCILSGGSVYYFQQFPPSPLHTIKVMKQQNITRMNAPPYFINQIIQCMQETDDFEPFKKMKFIGTGGAATPRVIDDLFLKHGINALNMFSMSECFNLISSDPSNERINTNTYFFLHDAESHCYLEPFDENRYQLVIKKESPFLATGVQNRKNGDYATKDLLVKSKDVSNGYNYAGRADDVLVMSNGEKTNPLPMEEVIRTNPLVSNCTVIAEGRERAAALIELNFEFAKDYCLETVFEKVHESVVKANEDAPDHSVILPEMVKIIPFSKHLVISDKGVISRKRSIECFKEEVEAMYAQFNFKKVTGKRKTCHESSGNIEASVMNSVVRVLNPTSQLDKNVSLFKQGLDSLLSIQLQNYFSEDIAPVPQYFAYEYPTISAIINYFEHEARPSKKIAIAKEFDYQNTTNILNQYLQRSSKDLVRAAVTEYADPNDDKEHIVLLTGATGSLGSAILLNLLDNPKVKKIYALVRGSHSNNLMDRIVESFRKRGLSESKLHEAGRVQALPMNLEQEYLGMSFEAYNQIKSETTLVLLCGWLLDFNQPVAHYETECIKGLYNMVKFANKELNPIHLHFISSVSATGAYGSYVPETVMPNDPKVALPMGYAQSKFIVEQLFHYFVETKNMPCFIYRVGQLCGDSITGYWNTSEMYPLILISGAKYMKKLPNLNTAVNWLPVNFAGQAIADIMIKTSTSSPVSANDAVFHIVNTNQVNWSSLIDSMKNCGMVFDVVEPTTWVEEIYRDQNNPCYKLLGFIQNLFENKNNGTTNWVTNKTTELSGCMKVAPTVTDRFVAYLRHWREVGFYTN
ncbi:hypothetical protein BD770DRAFT_440387 [Pilaira anomala]|nr:hypothetical protein BD770DRAFT_440387 [Pilaira anomala]